MLTADALKQIMPKASVSFLDPLNAAMTEFDIHPYLRAAAFLAQVAHESGEFKWMKEIWGPTTAQKRYEPPSTLASRLGNTQKGDGKRYMGRGPIQLTGRANYTQFAGKLGLDLVGKPELVETPLIGCRCAGLFWHLHDLNELADARNFKEITRRINGGTNGAAEREAYYARALKVLAPHNPPDHTTILVNGQDVTSIAKAITVDGHLMVPLRPLSKPAGYAIVDVSNGIATVRDGSGENHKLTILIKDGTGYVAFKDLPGHVTWDAATKTASLDT